MGRAPSAGSWSLGYASCGVRRWARWVPAWRRSVEPIDTRSRYWQPRTILGWERWVSLYLSLEGDLTLLIHQVYTSQLGANIFGERRHTLTFRRKHWIHWARLHHLHVVRTIIYNVAWSMRYYSECAVTVMLTRVSHRYRLLHPIPTASGGLSTPIWWVLTVATPGFTFEPRNLFLILGTLHPVYGRYPAVNFHPAMIVCEFERRKPLRPFRGVKLHEEPQGTVGPHIVHSSRAYTPERTDPLTSLAYETPCLPSTSVAHGLCIPTNLLADGHCSTS